MTDIVIGSGPAGVSAATALLARGRSVTLIDGGKTLEAENAQRRAVFASKAPEDWTRAERAAWQAPQFDTPPGQARRFGSDFAMEPVRETLATPPEWFGLRASRAVGGLSNLWGAAVLPYRAKDLAGWPITPDDLAPHYRAVADFMPIAGRDDVLATPFTALDMRAAHPVPTSAQGEALLKRLDRSQDLATALGVHAGAARVAVAPGCAACGMCLHGCPWGHIWTAAQQLNTLTQNENFTYQQGRIARSFTETENGIQLTLAGGDVLVGERLFIAAGVLETARLVLTSGPLERLTLKDSQHAFVPMLHRWRNQRRPDRMPLTTLPQIFAEIDAVEVSPHLVHAQLYTWNEHFAHDLIGNYGHGLPLAAPIFRALARRLIVAQIFLHSDHSARIGLALAHDGRLTATLEENPQTQPVLKRARQRLARLFTGAGLTTLGFASRAGAPGSSFHLGASLPMSNAAVVGQSDALGRPVGLSRVHVVDASVLTEVPAATITFSVMANAHRIASLAP